VKNPVSKFAFQMQPAALQRGAEAAAKTVIVFFAPVPITRDQGGALQFESS
jgi:hypothetical protein